jgi:hypothetical protein
MIHDFFMGYNIIRLELVFEHRHIVLEILEASKQSLEALRMHNDRHRAVMPEHDDVPVTQIIEQILQLVSYVRDSYQGVHASGPFSQVQL